MFNNHTTGKTIHGGMSNWNPRIVEIISMRSSFDWYLFSAGDFPSLCLLASLQLVNWQGKEKERCYWLDIFRSKQHLHAFAECWIKLGGEKQIERNTKRFVQIQCEMSRIAKQSVLNPIKAEAIKTIVATPSGECLFKLAVLSVGISHLVDREYFWHTLWQRSINSLHG